MAERESKRKGNRPWKHVYGADRKYTARIDRLRERTAPTRKPHEGDDLAPDRWRAMARDIATANRWESMKITDAVLDGENRMAAYREMGR